MFLLWILVMLQMEIVIVILDIWEQSVMNVPLVFMMIQPIPQQHSHAQVITILFDQSTKKFRIQLIHNIIQIVDAHLMEL